MKKLSSLISIFLLFSCSNNQVNPSLSTINKSNTNTLAKTLEDKLSETNIIGISSDILENTYFITNTGKIIKVDKNNNITESKEQSDYKLEDSKTLFFYIDSKGNGYIIPDITINIPGINTETEDPITKKIRFNSRTPFLIYKIKDLNITDTYIVRIEDYRFGSYCLSQDDCSDLFLNVGGINYSLNEFLKSKKEFIENEDLNSTLGGNGNGFYIKRFTNTSFMLYSFIDGITKKIDLPLTFKFKYNVDSFGNGFMIYEQENTSKYKYIKINNYNLGISKDIDTEIDSRIYGSIYTNIDENGKGFTIYGDNLLRISNFKINNEREFLLSRNDIDTHVVNVNAKGDGYIVINAFQPFDYSIGNSKLTPRIFIIKNNSLVK